MIETLNPMMRTPNPMMRTPDQMMRIPNLMIGTLDPIIVLNSDDPILHHDCTLTLSIR
jgi:hypothetical protein